ncbi:uncharacterized protein LOC115883801 [Sitophilus oryzae]|uniref:Uncharacterized protein LOC115883801 n=1 Tax=Sitophilus oryzae TaxID=7048 RepID=A0A6J2Y2Y7_SITOR|nr:uncharacterized protein LOC115883801 [Sitophilus oryzae]
MYDDSEDSDYEFCYIYDADEIIEECPRTSTYEQRISQLAEESRKDAFQTIFHQKKEQIFSLPGVNFLKFTHRYIKFCFQPNLIYNGISQKYIFYCSLRYLKRYGKWILKREPMPAQPLYRKVIPSVFIEDDIISLSMVICKVYEELKKWAKREIKIRRDKYERYRKGQITYIDIDLTDEELYFSDDERQALHEKRITVLKRMIPPGY